MTRSFYRSWMEAARRSSIYYARKNLNRLLPVSLELTVSQIFKVCSVAKHGNNRNLLHKTSSNEAMRWRQQSRHRPMKSQQKTTYPVVIVVDRPVELGWTWPVVLTRGLATGQLCTLLCRSLRLNTFLFFSRIQYDITK